MTHHSEPKTRYIKNVKVAILFELLDAIHAQEVVTREKPFIFSSVDIADNLSAYQASISREIRALKKAGFLDYVVEDRLKGTYRMVLSTRKWNKGAFEHVLVSAIKQLNDPSTDTPGNQIKKMINDFRNRRIQTISSKSQEGQ